MKKILLGCVILGVMMTLLLSGCSSMSTAGNSTTQAPQFVQTTTHLKPIVIQIEVTNPNWQSQLAQYQYGDKNTYMQIYNTSCLASGEWLKRAKPVDPNAVPYFFGDTTWNNMSDADKTIYREEAPTQNASIVISKNIATITIYQPIGISGTLYLYNQQ